MTFFRFQPVLASKLAPTWLPKTVPKSSQNLTNRQQISTKPTRRSQNGSEARKTSKNMQKSSKKLPTWPHHGNQILTKSMQKASPGTDFLGTRKNSKHVQQSTTAIPLWLHHGTAGLPYGKVSSATSAVCQGCSQPASSNTMHSFVFFHDRLYEIWLLCHYGNTRDAAPVPEHRSNSKKLRSNHAKT